MNQTAEKQEKKGKIIKYVSETGRPIELVPSIVREYLVSGSENASQTVTDKEIIMFMALCERQMIDPWIREAYLVKYGNSPAQMVIGIEKFRKRAVSNPKYRGHQLWLVSWGESDEEKVARCEVHVEGYAVPIAVEVSFDEYVGKKKDGEVNSMWRTKPRTMLKKVAESQALRTAFPKDMGGLYTIEEMANIQSKFLSKEPIKPPADISDAAFTDIDDELKDMADTTKPTSEPESEKPAGTETGSAAPADTSEKGKEIPGIDKYQLSSLLALMKDMPEEARRKWLDKYQTGDPATLTAKQAKELIGDLNAEKRK